MSGGGAGRVRCVARAAVAGGSNVTIKNSSGTVLKSLACDYSYLDGPTTKHGGLIHSVTDQNGQKTIYTYKDPAVPEDVGRLVKAHVQGSAGGLIQEWRYGYDPAGTRVIASARPAPVQRACCEHLAGDAADLGGDGSHSMPNDSVRFFRSAAS
jgi:hypothetical protein